MTVITLMGRALQRELSDRGFTALPLLDCEAIVAAVLEKVAEGAERAQRESEQE